MNSKNPLSSEEVTLLIHKLITDSKKLVALLFNSRLGVIFSVPGRLEMGDNGLLMARSGDAPSMLETSMLIASLPALLKVPCEFADPRLFKDGPFASFFEKDIPLSFGLVFVFPDGSILALIDVGEPMAPV